MRRAQALVELALIVPLIVLVLVGVVDLGRVFYYHVAVQDAAIEGARQAANVLKSDAEVRSAAQAALANQIAVADEDIAVSPPAPRQSGQLATVQVIYRFTPVTPLAIGLLSDGPVPVTGRATMVVQ